MQLICLSFLLVTQAAPACWRRNTKSNTHANKQGMEVGHFGGEIQTWTQQLLTTASRMLSDQALASGCRTTRLGCGHALRWPKPPSMLTQAGRGGGGVNELMDNDILERFWSQF